MSWEGYHQRLCSNGHYWTVDGYLSEPEECRVCGEKFVWENIVDTTNGSYDDNGERIDGFIELEIKEERKCEHCGSILGMIYKIPNN